MENAAEVQQTEADELASLMAGYEGKARGASETPPAEPEHAEPEPTPAEPNPVEKLAAELADFKGQVKALASAADPKTIRDLHGQIGDINRTLQGMQKKQEKDPAAPVDDELTAALKSAEAVATEFPELAGPLVNALKVAARQKAAAAPIDLDQEVNQRVTAALTEAQKEEAKRRYEEGAEQLAEEHPDFYEVSISPEFDAWVKSKTPEQQNKIRHTLNPALSSRYLTEFKAAQQAQKQTKENKRERLAAGVVDQSAATGGKPSHTPDEEGLWAGYNRGRKRLNER